MEAVIYIISLVLGIVLIKMWFIFENINNIVARQLIHVGKVTDDINKMICSINERIDINNDKIKHHSDALSDLYDELIKLKTKIK